MNQDRDPVTEAALVRLLHHRAATTRALPELGPRVVQRGRMVRRRRRVMVVCGAGLAAATAVAGMLALRPGGLRLNDAPVLPAGTSAPTSSTPETPSPPPEPSGVPGPASVPPTGADVADEPWDTLVAGLPAGPAVSGAVWTGAVGERLVLGSAGGTVTLPTWVTIVTEPRHTGAGVAFIAGTLGEDPLGPPPPSSLYLASGTTLTTLVRGDIRGYAVSPDGAEVAVALWPSDSDQPARIVVVDLHGATRVSTSAPAMTMVTGWTDVGVLLSLDPTAERPNWRWWVPGEPLGPVLGYRQVRVTGDPATVLVQTGDAAVRHCWQRLTLADNGPGPMTACTQGPEKVWPSPTGRYLLHGNQVFDLASARRGHTLLKGLTWQFYGVDRRHPCRHRLLPAESAGLGGQLRRHDRVMP